MYMYMYMYKQTFSNFGDFVFFDEAEQFLCDLRASAVAQNLEQIQVVELRAEQEVVDDEQLLTSCSDVIQTKYEKFTLLDKHSIKILLKFHQKS